jgi:hypothetical protein
VLCIEIIEQHGIEATRTLRLAGHIVAGGEDDATLLGHTDAGSGTAEIAAAAHAHFDKDPAVVIVADQIDLAATDSKVALDDAQTTPFQVFRGQ